MDEQTAMQSVLVSAGFGVAGYIFAVLATRRGEPARTLRWRALGAAMGAALGTLLSVELSWPGRAVAAVIIGAVAAQSVAFLTVDLPFQRNVLLELTGQLASGTTAHRRIAATVAVALFIASMAGLALLAYYLIAMR